MELKDFISYTISQITEGVINSQKKCERGIIINPTIDEGNTGDYYIEFKKTHDPQKRRIHTIDMDIAVTLTESKENGGGVRIGVACLNAGGQIQKETSKEEESRVKFSIPVCFPLGY